MHQLFVMYSPLILDISISRLSAHYWRCLPGYGPGSDWRPLSVYQSPGGRGFLYIPLRQQVTPVTDSQEAGISNAWVHQREWGRGKRENHSGIDAR